MHYLLESARLWIHTLSVGKNLKLGSIIFKMKEKLNDAKLKYQEGRANKIIIWIKNNVKCKDYIGRICLSHIQQKF